MRAGDVSTVGSHFTDGTTIHEFLGTSGKFAAVALFGEACLAIFLAFKEEPELTLLELSCLYGVAAYSVVCLFDSVVYWRSMTEGLANVRKGSVDPLAALDKIPIAKKLMKWYNDNFAVHSGGRYTLLLVIFLEVFEIVVQAYNANKMAEYLAWTKLSAFGGLICGNCIVFGVCMLTDERYASPVLVISLDVIFGEPRIFARSLVRTRAVLR